MGEENFVITNFKAGEFLAVVCDRKSYMMLFMKMTWFQAMELAMEARLPSHQTGELIAHVNLPVQK